MQFLVGFWLRVDLDYEIISQLLKQRRCTLKNIRKIILFYLIIFALGFPVLAQDIVKNPELPSDYEQWPNVFGKNKNVSNVNVSCHFYFRKLKDGWKENLFLLKIDQEIIFSDYVYFQFQREENHNHDMMFPDKGNGHRIIHWALSKDYLRIDSRNFEKPSTEELKKLSDQEMEELINRLFKARERLIQNEERMFENRDKIKSLGVDPEKVEDFVEEIEKELVIFLKNLM